MKHKQEPTFVFFDQVTASRTVIAIRCVDGARKKKPVPSFRPTAAESLTSRDPPRVRYSYTASRWSRSGRIALREMMVEVKGTTRLIKCIMTITA